MKCDECANWVHERKTLYENGEEVVHFRAEPGSGGCRAIGIDTKADFGCNRFVAGDEHVEILARKSGAPWQHSKSGPCPDCSGKGNAGDSGCYRCTGTGQVRHYDDGHIGEERTRLHPKERELVGKPKCAKCGREVEADWKVCPTCGTKLDAVAETEVVTDPIA